MNHKIEGFNSFTRALKKLTNKKKNPTHHQQKLPASASADFLITTTEDRMMHKGHIVLPR